MNSGKQCDRIYSMGRIEGRKYKTIETEVNEICRKTEAFLKIIHCIEPILRIIHCAEPNSVFLLHFLKLWGQGRMKEVPTVEVPVILSCGVMSS